MNTIQVSTGRPYEVLIGRDILKTCGKVVKKLPEQRYGKIAVITDSNVNALYSQIVMDSFFSAGFEPCKYVFPAGEASKNMAVAGEILAFLADSGITRSDLVVALGGGVVGDIAGFAAALYQRGVDYMQIPTTLLAAVDSSVGGKTAVNIPQGKNLVGAFWQPVCVLMDVDALSTLTPEVFSDGMAEVIKYGCIWDRELFHLLANGGMREHLEAVIARCVEIKAHVVNHDERDHGLRQILNFGHTIGHAVEKQSDFAVEHGKAVAIGMVMMTQAGEANGITRIGTADGLKPVLELYGLPTSCEYALKDLCRQCLGDKKRSGSSLNLILLESMGKCRIHPVQTGELASFMQKGEPV